MNWLLEPLAYQFMQRGLLASVIVGVLCAVMGTYVVLRGMAFLGDAMAHAILPGVAIAYLLQGNLLVGAGIAAVIIALSIGFFSREGTVKEDTAIGIMFAAALSLGVALISSMQTYAVDLIAYFVWQCIGCKHFRSVDDRGTQFYYSSDCVDYSINNSSSFPSTPFSLPPCACQPNCCGISCWCFSR